jgi:hypothetical protein
MIMEAVITIALTSAEITWSAFVHEPFMNLLSLL